MEGFSQNVHGYTSEKCVGLDNCFPPNVEGSYCAFQGGIQKMLMCR
jgi:hypothetical protein